MDYSEDEPFSSSRNLLLLFVSYRPTHHYWTTQSSHYITTKILKYMFCELNSSLILGES